MPTKTFTFHYVSILILGIWDVFSAVFSFTFHYVSILIQGCAAGSCFY